METQKSKNVSKIRTFATDAALMRTTQEIPLPPSKTKAPAAEEPIIAQIPKKEPVPQSVPKAAITKEEERPTAHAPAFIPPKSFYEQKITPVQTIVPKKPERRARDPYTTAPVHSGGFLDLEEESAQIGVHHKESLLTDNTFEAGEGTIIRDTKRKRFRLLPSMVEALTGWVAYQKAAYEAYRHPQNKITTSDARKEVIERAIQKSALAPREDFEEVASRKKQEHQDPIVSTLMVKKKEAAPKPQWSHIVEETEPQEAINAPEAAQSAAPVVSEPEPAYPAPIEPKAVPPHEEALPIIRTQKPPLPETVQVEEKIPHTLPEAPAASYQPAVETAKAAPQEQLLPKRTELPKQAPIAAQKPTLPRTFTIPRQVQRYALIGVILAATISGVALSMYLFDREDTPQEIVVVYQIPSLINAQAQIELPLDPDRNAFMQNLAAFTMQNELTVQIYPSVIYEEGPRPASTQEVLSVLSLQAPGSFLRSIKELTFGAVGNEPFMVLKATSFDVAFAGMLEWERTISSDLSPVFGLPVTESFDPSARTDSQARSAFFKDAIASNKNVRILFDEKGNDRIIYTFIDQETILITTTREALSVLVPLLQ